MAKKIAHKTSSVGKISSARREDHSTSSEIDDAGGGVQARRGLWGQWDLRQKGDRGSTALDLRWWLGSRSVAGDGGEDSLVDLWGRRWERSCSGSMWRGLDLPVHG